MKNNIKIVISGGHLTPALALIDYIQAQQLGVEISVIGRLYSQSGKAQRSREQKEIKQRQLPFYHLPAPKFANGSWWQILIGLPQLVLSTVRAWIFLKKIKPQVFVSFGGYLAVPIALAAKLNQIPIITHEQTLTLGLANKVISKIANTIAVSHAQTLELLGQKNGVVTGNPLRIELFAQQEKPEWLSKTDRPIIYITGGRLGSEVLNNTVGRALPQLLKKYVIVHQTGPNTATRNYTTEMDQIVRRLSGTLQRRYYQRSWITVTELGWLLQNVNLVVSRAGANITSELRAMAKKSILIPLPFAFNNEQQKNAQNLVDEGLALILDQKDLEPGKLISSISIMLAEKKINEKQGNGREQRKIDKPALASELLWQEVKKLAKT